MTRLASVIFTRIAVETVSPTEIFYTDRTRLGQKQYQDTSVILFSPPMFCVPIFESLWCF